MKKTEEEKAKKANHDKIWEIKRKLASGEPTTFAERNIVNIYDKRKQSKEKTMKKALIILCFILSTLGINAQMRDGWYRAIISDISQKTTDTLEVKVVGDRIIAIQIGKDIQYSAKCDGRNYDRDCAYTYSGGYLDIYIKDKEIAKAYTTVYIQSTQTGQLLRLKIEI